MAEERNPWEENYGTSSGQQGPMPWEQSYKTDVEAQKPAGALRRLKQGISNTVDAARVAATNNPEEIAGIMGEADKNRIPASPAQVKMQEEIAPYVKRANEATGVVDNVLAWGSAAAKRAGQFIQNPSEFAGMVAENLPNSAPGMAGGLAGAAVGSSLGPVGTAVGGVVGGTAGGYAVEQGSSMQEQIQKEAKARGISLQDKAGLTALISEKYPEFLGSSRLKGAGTALTDSALNVATMGLAGAGGRAIAKEARALGEAAKAGKIGATEAAQQLAGIEAKNAARNTLGATVKRGAGITGAEMLGEGASEAVGQKLGYGHVDAGDVIDESLLGLGTGVGMAASQKVVNKITGSREFDPASAEIKRASESITPPVSEVPPSDQSTGVGSGMGGTESFVPPAFTTNTQPTTLGTQITATAGPGFDVNSVLPKSDPVRDMVQQAADAGGPNSAAALVGIDSGAHEIQFANASAADQDAYNSVDLDSADKPITHGKIAEAAMSDDDKRAVLYSNQPVADGGQRYPGTQDGDILNGSGAPFGTWQAAGRRASMEGKSWTIAKVADGFVARRKDAMQADKRTAEPVSARQADATPDWAAQAADEERQQGPLQVQPQPKGMNMEQRKANLAKLKERMLAGRSNGTTNAVQPLPATGSGIDGNQQSASMGLGNADGNGLGTDAGGYSPHPVVQSGEQPTAERAVETTGKSKNLASLKEKVMAGWPQFKSNPQPTTLGTQTTAKAGPGFDASYLPQGTHNVSQAPQAVAPETQRQEAPAATVETEPQVFIGKSTLFDGYGASHGSITEGNRRQLMLDPSGGYFWGDWHQESKRDVGAVAGGVDKDSKPASFTTSKEAREAANKTPAAKTAPAVTAEASQPAQPVANAGEGAGASQPTQAANAVEESQQDKSIREWTENYDKVSNTDNLSGVSDADLARAIAWASRKKQSEQRKGWDGGQPNQNVVDALTAEIERIKAEESRRRGEPTQAAPTQPALVRIKSIDGKHYHVQQSDLDSGKSLLPTYTANGKRSAVRIHRENLDPTGEKQAANNAEDANNPLFNVIATKNGAPFGDAAAANRALKIQKRGDTHEVVPASEVKPGMVGFVLRRKVNTGDKNTVNKQVSEEKAQTAKDYIASVDQAKQDAQQAAQDAPRETVTPAEDKPIGKNDAGEQLYERKDGSVYRIHDGKPVFGGDLAPKQPSAPATTANDATEKVADGKQESQSSQVSQSSQPSNEPTSTPEVKSYTAEDVAAAEKQAAQQIEAQIDKLKGDAFLKIAKRFLPTMGVKPTLSKASNKAAFTGPKVNLLAAASELGVELSASVRAALEAKQEGKVQEAANDRVPEQSTMSHTDAHAATMQAVREGTATPEQFKASFEAVVSNKDAIKAELMGKTKAELLKIGGPFVQMRYANEKKADIVDIVYREMVGEYALGESVTYGMAKDSYQNAIRRMVDATDADKLAQYVKDRKAAIAEYVAERAAKAAALENPQTLDDYRAVMRQHVSEGKTSKEAFLMLTPEQRVRFDELSAESTKESREARKRAAKTEVRAAGQTTAGEIIATKHTRDGYDLFVVKLADRVSKEDYATLLGSAKRMGGWYSAFRGNGAIPGFQFKDKANAEAFLKLAAGDTTEAQAKAAERRDAFEDDRSQSAVERLTEMADRLEERATESLGADRKANTARRARFAAAAEASAHAEQALAKTMRNLAQAIGDGTAKFLDAVRQKTQVEMLSGFVRTAKDAELRATYPSYAEQERHKGEKPTDQTADFAEFPSYTAFRSDLASLARQLLEVDGTKKIGQQLMKVADDVTDAFNTFAKENSHQLMRFSTKDGGLAAFGTQDKAQTAIDRSGFKGKAIPFMVKRGEWTIITSPSEAINQGIWKGDGDKRITLARDFGNELVQAIGRRGNKQNQLSVPWQFENANTRLKALSRMGIETSAEFRSALREFIRLQEQPAAPDKVKELERAMVGRRNDGMDFFPTPQSVADEMVQAAGIEPGMSVLEPSAGMGHIAERIRESGVEPDVVEMANDRRELLEAKGFNVVGRDFMEMSPRDFTYGDVFRAPDGTLGVMRGSGGMGSGRVGLDPLDANGNPDPRNSQWHDRDSLVGVEKRGTSSGYDRILMNPPFSDGRDIQHVQHAYSLLKPGGRLVAIMGESAFTNQNKRATEFRDWLEAVGGTEEKLPDGSFMDHSLPVNTGVNARMVVIDKPAEEAPAAFNSGDRKYSVARPLENGERASSVSPGFYVNGVLQKYGREIDFNRSTAVGSMGHAMVKFSRTAQGQANGTVEQTVADIVKGWATRPKIVVAFDMNDERIPERVRMEDQKQRSGGASGAPEGFYYKGTVYLMSSKLATPEDVARVLFHEALGHHGLRSVFGKKLNSILNRIAMARKSEVDAKMAQYGLKGISKVDRLTAAEEILAEMAQTKPNIGFVREAIAAIRTWLRENIPGFKNLALTDDEIIRSYIVPARNFVERGGTQSFGMFAPSMARDAGPRESDVSPIGFYSALARGIEASTANIAPALGWKATIKGLVNKGLAKADEVEWSGVNEWLDMQGGKVAKTQVLDFLRGNGVQVRETVLGGAEPQTISSDRALARLRDGLPVGWRRGNQVVQMHDPDSIVESESYYRETVDAGDAEWIDTGTNVGGEVTNAKYGSYTLPGGENYREVLLTLPDTRTERFKSIADEMLTATPEQYAKLHLERTKLFDEHERQYTSSHWSQKNVLAHIRLNDRTDADGAKTLFIEELQSDFAQDYRKSKEAINKAVDDDFTGIIERMKKAGLVEVNCD